MRYHALYIFEKQNCPPPFPTDPLRNAMPCFLSCNANANMCVCVFVP